MESWLKFSYWGKESEFVSLGFCFIQVFFLIVIDVGGFWQVIWNVWLMVGIYNLFDEFFLYEEFGYVEDGW